ncbi:Bromodomain and WD repeat-containing protein 3 [Borealophlyctis nickersoniae]|nr:Bromodomain and WD repeat-containing protein 3 [Borealophlyctis nickersoniae]
MNVDLFQLKTVHGHLCAVYNGIFDRTGTVFITGGDDSLVKVWCAQTGWLEQTVILDMCVNDDNTMLATASSDMTVRVWNMQSWDPVALLNIQKDIATIAFSPSPVEDNKCLLVTGGDGKTRVFRWLPNQETFSTTPIVLDTAERRTDRVITGAFNRTGTKFAIGGSDGFVYVFSILPVPPAPIIPPGSSFHRIDVPEAEDNHRPKLLARIEASSFDPNDKKRKKSDISVKEIRFSHRGDRFCSGCFDGTTIVHRFDVTSKTWSQLKLSLEEPTTRRDSGTRHLSSARRNLMSTGAEESEDEGNAEGGVPPPPASFVPVVPDIEPATAFTAAPLDGTVLGNGAAVGGNGAGSAGGVVAGHMGPQPDGTVVGQIGAQPVGEVVGQDGNGAPAVPPAVDPAAPAAPAASVEVKVGVTQMAWSLDDARIITVMADGLVRIWDSKTGSLLHTLAGHTTGEIYTLDIHPHDARVIMTAGYDGKLIIWDIVAGRKLRQILNTIKEFDWPGSILSGCFSPAGDKLMTVDGEGMAHLYGHPSSFDSYAKTPLKQFFESDWVIVRQDLNGALIDESTQLAPHLVDLGCVVDNNHTPYMEYAAVKGQLPGALSVENEMVAREREVKMALLREENGSLLIEQEFSKPQPVDMKRRRARGLAEASEDEAEIFQAIPIVPLPESSGDEFEHHSDDVEEESEEESEHDRSDDAAFVASDSDAPSHRKRRRTTGRTKTRPRKRQTTKKIDRRKRRKASDDDLESELDGGGTFGRPVRKRAKLSYKEDIDSSESSASALTETESEEENGYASSSPSPPRKGKNAAKPKRPSAKKRDRPGIIRFGKNLFGYVPEPIPKVPSEWVSIHQPKAIPYLPQLNDFVAYIKVGHKEFIRCAQDTLPNHMNQNWKSVFDDRRPPIVFGLIQKLEFHPTSPVTCTLEIQVYAPDDDNNLQPTFSELRPVKCNDRKDILTVVYTQLETCTDFIVLFDDYCAGVGARFARGEKVLVQYVDKEHEGWIVDVNDKDAPWNMYTVRWPRPDHPPDSFSPWEMRRADNEMWQPNNKSLQPEEVARVKTILEEWMENPQMEAFVDPVDYAEYPIYLGDIAYPMCFTYMLSRLEQGFYRQIESVAWDVDIMMRNAMKFNLEGSAIYQHAKMQLPQLKKEILGAPRSAAWGRAASASGFSPSSESSQPRLPPIRLKISLGSGSGTGSQHGGDSSFGESDVRVEEFSIDEDDEESPVIQQRGVKSARRIVSDSSDSSEEDAEGSEEDPDEVTQPIFNGTANGGDAGEGASSEGAGSLGVDQGSASSTGNGRPTRKTRW